MFPDSRRPRRLAIVISAIDDERDLDPDVVRRSGTTDWIWAIADAVDTDDRHHVVDEQGRGGDQPEDRREVGLGHDVGAAAVRDTPGRPGGTRRDTTASRTAIAIDT